MIFAYSLRKYIPRYHILRQLGEEEINSARTDSQSDPPRQVLVGSYIIPGTEFYAVTSYRNRDVVETKIRQNKYAKGFRDRGARGG
ncbi:unnamed protein product [Mesocestoides corti]|uniref:T-box domain-containing protein n=1 Tax=Mesocestoides corti TaxID=53468 RepID=A0A0R3UCJ2_MESCO|nr:unnamed protein product [Mesocestoides corti]